MEEDNPIVVTDKAVMEIAQQRIAMYDKIRRTALRYYFSLYQIHARQRSQWSCVYWLARMIEGGEDVKFIARRMLILASEDIGNANPTALVMANATFDAVSKIGYPESRIILAQCAVYLLLHPRAMPLMWPSMMP